MTIISILFAVIMIAGIYFYINKNRATKKNHYRKQRNIPTLHAASTKPTTDNYDDDALLGENNTEKKPLSSSAPKIKSVNSQADSVIILYLMAPEGSAYAGYELLQALLSAGLRYGKQRIFNRHEQKDGRGYVLFNCASAIAPGTFDLTKMGAFSCKGLCLFFTTSSVQDPLSTFDCMLETVDQLVEDIGGQVLDDKRATFTKERMVQYRQQIRTYENGKMTADMFA